MSQSGNVRILDGVEVPPFRNLNEFLFTTERYERPPFNDLPKWNNRIMSNLLYFQTNYFAMLAFMFILHTFFSAQDIFIGLIALVAAMGVAIFSSSLNPNIHTMRKDHPLITLGAIIIVAYLFISVLSSVFVVLFAILFPVLLVLIHASLRLRGVANKTTNLAERSGLRTTLMGTILERLGFSIKF
ncbi:unnamed protein product [Caenorhabditis auriculariae]|uniref:PRA1 family protein n=1 Tax=Caenorhabditis auriculariae TaxID=2777116 RepID=A0A8S1HBA2_9PELO|nr:unnamed protein product [Caenorhabditis auriculariae]